MVSEEKTMMKILRDYLICRLYAGTSISSRNISSLTGVSTAVVKRAIHLLEEKQEECLRLLPLAYEKAVRDGILTEKECMNGLAYIDKEHLDLLQAEIEVTALTLQIKNRWAASSMESGATLLKIVEKINNRYFSQKRDVSLTKSQVKKLINSGGSFQKAADKFGISKTTAHNYYKSGVSSDDRKASLEEIYTTRRR